MQSFDLAGRRTLVTGGAGGIGKAAAELFTQLGARVVIADVEARSASEAAAETQALGFQVGDVSVEADAMRMVDGAADQLGGLDAVFHCAGIHKVAPAMAQQISDWQRVMDVNVRGPSSSAALQQSTWRPTAPARWWSSPLSPVTTASPGAVPTARRRRQSPIWRDVSRQSGVTWAFASMPSPQDTCSLRWPVESSRVAPPTPRALSVARLWAA